MLVILFTVSQSVLTRFSSGFSLFFMLVSILGLELFAFNFYGIVPLMGVQYLLRTNEAIFKFGSSILFYLCGSLWESGLRLLWGLVAENDVAKDTKRRGD